MFVEAIVNENIETELTYLEIGNEIYGSVRSYNQNFMNIEIPIDVEVIYDASGDAIDANYIVENRKLKIKKGSIKPAYCGCGNRATRYQSELLCDDCEYEEPYYERLDTGHHAMDYMRDWDF